MANPIAPLRARLTATVARRRERWGWFDHLARAGARYRADLGDRLAAGITYYGFLSLFPVLLLGLSVLGYVLADDPDRQLRVFTAISEALPGVGSTIIENLRTVMEHRGTAGVVGLVGLAFSGLGWIDALREALRTVWHQEKATYNVAKRKLVDLVVLAGLGVTVLVSLAISAVGAGVTTWVLGLLGLDESVLATGALAVTSFVLAVLADMMLFSVLFYRLAAVARPPSRVWRGALFGAVGFNLLKLVGTVYVGRTVSNGVEVYGTFAVVVGLMVWINLVSRFVLFAAAWTVTDDQDSDVRPSGTADPHDSIPADRPSGDLAVRPQVHRGDLAVRPEVEPYPEERDDARRAAVGALAGAGVGLLVVNALRGRRAPRD